MMTTKMAQMVLLEAQWTGPSYHHRLIDLISLGPEKFGDRIYAMQAFVINADFSILPVMILPVNYRTLTWLNELIPHSLVLLTERMNDAGQPECMIIRFLR